ncbi:MAG: DnaJ family molecular chaperone [Candidatus Cryptobacteroides sp.]
MFYIISILIQVLLLRLLISFISSFFRGDRRAQGAYGGQSTYGERSYSETSLVLAYQTLGVAPDSTDGEVKSAYRRLAVQFHPDKFATSSREVQLKAEEQFKKINEAYQLIKKKRGLD